jgi:hypothetical protein
VERVTAPAHTESLHLVDDGRVDHLIWVTSATWALNVQESLVYVLSISVSNRLSWVSDMCWSCE